MLKNTKKTIEIYEDIQRKLYYMIPEKWDELYLYASVIDKEDKTTTGELFFYYVPKGILRKKAISVYEIPSKFNLEEKEYLKLVDILYSKFIELRNEHKRNDTEEIWSNLTLIIKNAHFKVEFDYADLTKSDYNSYERHILWRYYILGITLEQCTREEREIIKNYETGAKILGRKEKYETGIYMKNIKNIVDYTTQTYEEIQAESKDIEYIADEEKRIKNKKNQILMGIENEADEVEEKIERDKKQSKYMIE